MSASPQCSGEEIVRICRGLGFALAGIADARATDHRAELEAWLREGRHGGMSWLERRVEERADPSALLPGARSIIIVADQYSTGAGNEERGVPRHRGRIARYARGDDYHDVMKRRLHSLCDSLRAEHPDHQFRAFVDTAPVLEREHAARAGLGWIGKHTLLIHPRRGSWLLLGGVLTTIEIGAPSDQQAVPDHCGTCSRCIDACPTSAITPYSVDARRCISYLTIEHRGPIPGEFQGPIGDRLFGCDICQDVCPHNRERETDHEVLPAYLEKRDSFDLLDVLGWTEDDRRSALARSALKRANLEMWKRNALIVAGNSLIGSPPGPGEDLLRRIAEIAGDPSEPALVRATAREVLDRAQ